MLLLRVGVIDEEVVSMGEIYLAQNDSMRLKEDVRGILISDDSLLRNNLIQNTFNYFILIRRVLQPFLNLSA